MVSASFQTEHIDSLWSIAQIVIGFGTVACMCCVLFLGLKLKWFRAQLKLQDTPPKASKSDTVQAIGFKVKTSADDYQQYKSISEFSTPVTVSVNNPNNLNNKNESLLNEIKLNTFAKVEIKNEVVKSKSTETLAISLPKEKEKQIKTNEIQVQEIKKKKKKEKESTDLKYKDTATTSTSDKMKQKKKKEKGEKKDKVKKPKNKESSSSNEKQTKTNGIEVQESKGKKVSFVKNTTIINEVEDQQQQQQQQQQDEIRNAHFNIIEQTPKIQIDHRADDIYYNEIHLTNSNSSDNNNSMYSSQAASIFFGSYEEQEPPNCPPPPIPRKFLEEDDNISTTSQTSA